MTGSRIGRASKFWVSFVGRSTEDQPSDDMRTHETFVVPISERGYDMGPYR